MLKYGGRLILKRDVVPSISVPCLMKQEKCSITKGPVDTLELANEQCIPESVNDSPKCNDSPKRQHQTGIYFYRIFD